MPTASSDYRSLGDLARTWTADVIYRPFAWLGFRGRLNRALRRGVPERLEPASPYSGMFLDRWAAPDRGGVGRRTTLGYVCSSEGPNRDAALADTALLLELDRLNADLEIV